MPENNLSDIKKRISAAGQTRKITRTMELIASSRLQRSKTLLAGFQEWMEYMHVAARCLPDSYFALSDDTTRSNDKRAYILFGGSKGLAGAYAPNLLQYALPILKGRIVVTVGSAVAGAFSDAHSSFGDEAPSTNLAESIAKSAKILWEGTEADEIHMIYTKGVRHITQQLLPLAPLEKCGDVVIIEPSGAVLFPALFEEYVMSLIYEAHLQAYVSEQIARVSAMDSATRNADEIIETLQTSYNRIRQTSITQEIIAVSNAARGDG